MSVVLNHTIVPVTDKKAGARFFADLLGLRTCEVAGPFVPVRVNADDTFDAVLDRLGRDPAIDYGSGPQQGWDRQINHLGGGRGIYVRDPDGHSYELFTAVP